MDTDTKYILPSVPSEMLMHAYNDGIKCLNDERYVFNMGVWHSPVDGGDTYCGVCLAGAILAQTCRADPTQFIGMPDLGKFVSGYFEQMHLTNMLQALNQFRLGCFESFFHSINTALSYDLDLHEPLIDGAQITSASRALYEELRHLTKQEIHEQPGAFLEEVKKASQILKRMKL